jgi:hypothetical protein
MTSTSRTLARLDAARPRRRPTSHARRRRLRGDLGEGVISVAIAVLIMAFLGAAMWIGFQQMWKTTEATTNTKVQQIGND